MAAMPNERRLTREPNRDVSRVSSEHVAVSLPSPRLLSTLGISRLASVGTMDRAGIDVVAAVRPRGHVLQVTQGKGLTHEAAVWSAVGEAAELHAAETIDDATLAWSRGDALDGLVLDDDGLRRAWVRGVRLSDDAHVWLAAERVFCPPNGRAWLGPSTSSWSSNGMGAHERVDAAVEHAVLELWERHALALAVPNGWNESLVAKTRVAFSCELTERLERSGFVVASCLLQLKPFPLAAALVFDTQDDAVPLAAGYACRRTVNGALEAAVLEAAQSRVTEIHGARDDVAVGTRVDANEWIERLVAGARVPVAAAVRGWPKAVSSRVVIIELRREPLVVVKAVGLGLEESELLR